MAIPGDIETFLNRKYAILQQQADAATSNANTANLTGRAQAGLDQVRTQLLPKESAASIAKMGAETGLIGQQASVIAPESRARIANLNAETALTGTNNRIAIREGLTERSILPDSLKSVMGLRGYTGYRLGSVLGE